MKFNINKHVQWKTFIRDARGKGTVVWEVPWFGRLELEEGGYYTKNTWEISLGKRQLLRRYFGKNPAKQAQIKIALNAATYPKP